MAGKKDSGLMDYGANPSAQFQTLFDGRGVLPGRDMDRETAWQVMSEFGVQAVKETMASGQLPNEIAISLGVPITYFREWLREVLTPDDVAQIREACAESHVLKSVLALTVTYSEPGMAAMARALSDRMMEIAERLDPDHWAARKPVGDTTSPVTIVFQGLGRNKTKEIDVQPVEEIASKAPEMLQFVIVEDDGGEEEEDCLPADADTGEVSHG